MSSRDEARRAREVLANLESARLRLSAEVMAGDPEAIERDRQLEKRIREIAGWIMSLEQEERTLESEGS